MSDPVFLTTGAQAQQSSPRLNIVSLQQNVKQFSLFVQALTGIKLLPSSTLESHYQIGGIHGLPQLLWDNVPQTVADPAFGYCHHGLQTFPTWHRPYVALYEQLVYDKARSIAASYTSDDRSEWLEAARSLRFPYWDWSSGQDVPSILISDTKVTIQQAPLGVTTTDYPNPFLSYTFQQQADIPAWDDHFKQTIRFAVPAGPDSKSDPKALVQFWARVRGNLAKDVRSTLTTQGLTWYDFSNHTTGNTVPGANSIETLHDRLHVYFGQGNGARIGHMADASVAELTPFWRTQTSFWTSDACRDTDTALKYSYDRLPMDEPASSPIIGQKVALTKMTRSLLTGIKAASTQVPFAAITKPIAGNGQDASNAASDGDQAKESTAEGNSQPSQHDESAMNDLGQDFALPFGPAVPQGPIQAPQAIFYKKWSARVRVEKECLGQSFAVEVYLLEDPHAPTPKEDDFAGDFWTFVNSRSRACENCNAQREAGTPVEGYIDLTDLLHERLEVNPTENQVKNYIEGRLFWQVIVSGTVIHPTDPRLRSLQVTIVSANARILLGNLGGDGGLPRPPQVIDAPHEHVRLSNRTNERYSSDQRATD